MNFPEFKAPQYMLLCVMMAQVVSCGTSYIAPPVTPPLVSLSSVSKSRLERGYEIHQLKCAKCHTFEDPRNYDADELEFDIMPEMVRKSKLSDEDGKAVLEYLLAARKILPEPNTP
jgi:cytochrome c5